MKPVICIVTLLSILALSTPSRVHAADSLIANGDFSNGMEGWVLNRIENAEAKADVGAGESGKQAVHINVPMPAAKRYYVQLVCKGVKMEADKTYHLHFRAHCKPVGEIVLLAASFHGKFEELWRLEKVAITSDWADYNFDFKPKYAEEDGQIIFSGLAAQAGDYWFGDVTLTEAQ